METVQTVATKPLRFEAAPAMARCGAQVGGSGAFDTARLREALADRSSSAQGTPMLRALDVEGVADLLANATDAATLARLAACSHRTRALFRARPLWTELLKRRWPNAPATQHHHPYFAYAQYEIMERWRLAPPGAHSPNAPSTPFSPLGATPKLWAGQMHTFGQENRHPNPQPATPATLVHGRQRMAPMHASGTGGTGVSERTASASGAGFCVRTRLKQDLFDIMMAGGQYVSAFPEEPDQLAVWRAKINCPAAEGSLDPAAEGSLDTGSLHAGVQFVLRLQFELDAQNAFGTLPHVQIVHPACFHPNVDAEGALCAEALRERCAPCARVCEVLEQISALLRSPCFAVKPLNGDAAALWYGDQQLLRHRAARARAVRAPGTPSAAARIEMGEDETPGPRSQPARPRAPLRPVSVSQGAQQTNTVDVQMA